MPERSAAPIADSFSEVRSARFVLRPLLVADVSPEYLAWFGDADVQTYIRAARSAQTLQSLQDFVAAKRASANALLLGIFDAAAGSHLGNIKFEPLDDVAGEAVVGVLIGEPDWRGKGVFAEVMQACVEPLRGLGVQRVWLGAERSNARAMQAYLKAGFVERSDPPARYFPNLRADVAYMMHDMRPQGAQRA